MDTDIHKKEVPGRTSVMGHGDYLQYFQYMYSAADPETFACISHMREYEDGLNRINWADVFFRADDAKGMAAEVLKWRDNCNIYASQNTFKKKDKHDDNVAQILRHSWVDIDESKTFSRELVEAEADKITDYSLKIDTGDGYHFVWDAVTPVEATQEAKDALDQRLTERVEQHHGDSGTKGANRVLRVPGTKNFPSKAKAVGEANKEPRGWEPRPVSEADLTDMAFNIEPRSTDNGAALPEPQVITREESQQGVTRDTCSLNLTAKTWDLIEPSVCGPGQGHG